MNLLGRAALKHADWDGYAAECAARIPADSPLRNADYIAREIAARRLRVFQGFIDGNRVGIIVYAIEEHDNGKELVTVAAYSHSGKETAIDFIAAIEDAARRLGCQQVRIHTARAGVVKRAVENIGFQVSEIILRKTITPAPTATT